MKRLAVIDCGTNTFNLLVIEVEKNARRILFKDRISVKLGQKSINEGYITAEALSRAFEALKAFQRKIKELGVKEVIAFGTSAIRDAHNGKEITTYAGNELGIDIEIIDGDREADLIYLGVRDAVKLNSTTLIMDVGGGSIEFILADENKIHWKKSYRLGAARLLEKFSPSDPITTKEILAIRNYLNEELNELEEKIKELKPPAFTGSSGVFESFIEILAGEFGGEIFDEDHTEYNLSQGNFCRVCDLVLKSSLEERRKIKGLLSIRVDMIVVSCVLVDFVLSLLHPGQIKVSTYSLKEGAVAAYLNGG